MKYFEFKYPSKKSRHPDGAIIVTLYAKGTTKKAAQKIADKKLEKEQGENVEFFKLPTAKFIEREQFEEIEALENAQIEEESEQKEPVLLPEKEAFVNEDYDKGLTVADMAQAVAAVVLFGHKDHYEEDELAEIDSFAGSVGEQSDDEKQAFTNLIEIIEPLMLSCYDKINDAELLEMVAQVDHVLVLTSDHDKAHRKGQFFLKNNAGIEFDEDSLVHIEPPATQSEPEPETDDFSFEFPELPEISDFEKELEELNAKLEVIAPGDHLVFLGLSNELYHAADGLSNSTLKTINRDPALLEWQKAAPVDDEAIETLNIGDAVHTAILEPKEYESRYVVEPPVLNEDGKPTTKANKHWKEKNAEFLEANKGKTILTYDQDKMIRFMAGSAMAHPTVKQLIDPARGEAETSIFYRDENGVLLKIRPDWMCVINNTHFIIDVKSCGDISDFDRTVANFDYHQQDAFYTKVYTAVFNITPIFGFLAVSKSVSLGRYPVRLVQLDEYDKQAGLALVEKALETYQECNHSGVWGGFETITRPAWAKKNDLFL